MSAYDDSPFVGHICNALCQPARGIHAVLTYSTSKERTAEFWAPEPGEGFDVLDARLAPEAPPMAEHLAHCPEFQELLDANDFTPQRHAIMAARGYAYLVILRDTDVQEAA